MIRRAVHEQGKYTKINSRYLYSQSILFYSDRKWSFIIGKVTINYKKSSLHYMPYSG